MTETLVSLAEKDRVSALLRDDLYGVFSVRGSVVRSATLGSFMVGSWLIESKMKPDKDLLRLTVLAEEPIEATDGPIVQATEVRHGDLVDATFSQGPHGTFSVRGHVVETNDGSMALVGRWIIAYRHTANHRLLELRRSAVSYPTQPPAKITRWRDSPEASG
ncbi:hypothetical protein [Nocardioides speluncae]|uniref:hypothetical protein n=1 Tax=Nocardioides speluncae TaxID=2670337 RepID=UPI0012B16F75|nr:hypothetical protein [Nocardioides speluncae]